MNIKSILKSNTFMVIIIMISVILCGLSYYYVEYKPKADAKKIEALSKKLISYNYNSRLAEQLIDSNGSIYHWININLLHDTSYTTNQRPIETPFTYYTKDGYKVSYYVDFRTSKKFFKLDANTQINVLTNIYNVCDHHFQDNFELENIFYETPLNEWVDKDKKFATALLYCIKNHINDNNYISNVKDINPEDISDSFDVLNGIGVISIDIAIKKDDSYKQNSDVCNTFPISKGDNDLSEILMSAKNEIKKIVSVKDFNDNEDIFISYNTYKTFNNIDFND